MAEPSSENAPESVNGSHLLVIAAVAAVVFVVMRAAERLVRRTPGVSTS